MPGYPIRTPSDHSSVGNSPRNIAASHVLHRLLMPRHPPCALDNLTHTLGANTTKKRPLPTGNTQQSKLFRQNTAQNKDARVHCAILNDHTDPNHRTPNQVPTHQDRPQDDPHPESRSPNHTTRSGCPLRTQQCAHANKTVDVSTFFSSNPTHLPPPTPPTTPPTQQGIDNDTETVLAGPST